jgi:hypothetical protein
MFTTSRTVLAVLVALSAACSSSPANNSGGYFLPDVLPGDISAADSEASDTATDTTAAGTDAQAEASDIDQPDYGDFFDDPDATVRKPDVFDDGCSERAKLVYVVTSDNTLYSFTPDKLAFAKVGKLACKAGSGNTPFSMSVDRDATAWVLYWNGAKGVGIHSVSTLDASCQSTAFQPGNTNVFGMGFSANGAYQLDETLFVVGSNSNSFWTGTNSLASIDTVNLGLSVVDQVDQPGSVELTGNGLGELYGLFTYSSPPSVRRIDKLDGTTQTKSWPLPANKFSSSAAMAFAQWGGAFYLFYKGSGDASTNVWKLDAVSGQVKLVVPNTGMSIVGAGVSSCAPTK